MQSFYKCLPTFFFLSYNPTPISFSTLLLHISAVFLANVLPDADLYGLANRSRPFWTMKTDSSLLSSFQMATVIRRLEEDSLWVQLSSWLGVLATDKQFFCLIFHLLGALHMHMYHKQLPQ